MIYVLGSINLDMIASGPRLPVPGETLIADNFATAPGGKGANQALASARAGVGTKLFGAVGSNSFAHEALQELKGGGVNLDNVKTVPGATGIAIILVEGSGENVIVIVPGANGSVDTELARQMNGQMGGTDILLMAQEVPAPAIKAALQGAKAKGITSILNIAPIIGETVELALLADIIVANETEYSFLTGVDDLSQLNSTGAEWARQHNKTLIVTLGGDGAVAFTPTKRISVKALPIDPVDSVGAGDTFCGYLAAGLENGNSLEEALERAAVAGSLACLKPGAQPAIPVLADVQAARNT